KSRRARLPEDEGEDIAELLSALRARRAEAVPRLKVDAQQDRLIGCCRLLQSRRHLSCFLGINARVSHSSREEYGRILRAILHMLIGVHRVESLESVFGRYRSEFGHVWGSVLRELRAQIVRDTYLADHSGEQIRTVGQRTSHRDAAGRTP